MKQITLLLFMFIVGIRSANAAPIDLILAKEVATDFYNSHKKTTNIQVVNFTLVHTEISTDRIPLYYVFNINQNDRYIVISGNDAASPILAYTFKGSFDFNNLPPAFSYWLDNYKRQLVLIYKNKSLATVQIFNKWAKYKNSARGNNQNTVASIIVNPLLKTAWGQSSEYNPQIPYNYYCPYDANANNGHCPTGCVATAMAQIMKYWNYPLHGIGSHSYSDGGILNPPSYGTQFANFGNETYDWRSMPNYLSTTAVATLMYHCGVSVDMDYSPSVSLSALAPPSFYSTAYNAYTTYFGYNSNTIDYLNRSFYTDATWVSKFKNELNSGRPIHCGGQDDNNQGGHSWVCDGYDSDDMFHINWGWGYGTDTWVYMNNLILVSGSTTYNFNGSQQAVIGIMPSTQPDLIPQNAQVSPSIVPVGGQTLASLNNKNQGTGTSNSSYTAVWLSQDQVFDGSPVDKWLVDIPVSFLNSGATSSLLSSTITIPSGTSTGTWYLMFGADATGCNTEINETNNQVFVPITIGNNCNNPTITSHPTNKSVTAPNGTNFGISASGSNNLYRWQYNTGSSWSNVPNTSPYSGATSTNLNISSTSVSMNGYQYRCYVTSSCTTATVTSNAATLTVSTSSTTCNNDDACIPKMLAISSSCFSTSCSTVGSTAPNPAIVYTSCSGTPYQNGRYDDDVWFAITPSSSNPVTIKVTPTSNLSNFDPVLGVYRSSCLAPTQTGCADVNSNGGAEQLIFTPIANTTYLIRVFGYGIGSAYSGNFDICVTAPGQSNPLPDLIITNASFSMNSLCAGGSLDVSYGVTNNGSASANSSTVKYYLSSDNNYSANDVLLGTTTIGSISSNATISHIRNLVIPQTTGVGGWYILIIADANNDVAEGANGEVNNVFSNTIQIANCSGSADLAIHYNNYNPATVTPGTTVHVNYTYENAGSIIAGPIHIGIYLSQDNTFDASTDEYLGNWFKGSLDPGQTATEFLNFTLSSCHQCGSYYVFLVIDYDNIVAESNENNNYDYFPIEITGCVTCNVSIPPTGLTFQSAGGTGNINVTTSQCCPWTATTNDNWITITNSLGTGNGAVSYSVSPCDSGGTKTGTINVNGQPHQITQNCTELCNASQSFEWAAQAGSPTYSEYAYDLTVDATGNVYMTGSIQGFSSFGNGITLITASSAPDVFVSKHNALGQIQWAVNFGNTGQDQGTGIAKDNSGNIYVVGSFNNSITFGSTTLTSNGANNDALFIVKLDPSNGSVIWANKINPTGSGFGVKIVIDNNDNIYLSGGGWFPFVAKYNTSGTQTLYQSYGYLTFNLSGIGYDNSSNIIISGNFSGTMTLGSITLTSISAYDGFVAKLDGNGNAIWAQQLSSSSTAQNTFNSVVVDAANNIYAIGNVNGTAIVGNITIPLSPGSKAIIIKFDQNGNPIWGKASTEGTQYPKKIVKGNDNNLYFSGYFGTSMKMDTTTIISTGSNDGFIVSMDDNGKVIWLKGFGSAQADEAYTIGLSTNSDVFVAGGFSGSVVYGNTTITSSGSIDIFLAKFKQCVPPNANVTYTGNLVLCPGQTMNLSTSYCSSNIYQWVLNNSEIGNANDPTYTATEPGSYKVKVSSFVGCETISDPVTISSSGTYTFTGDGNWDVPTNWNNNTIPPDVLPSCYEIIVNPQIGGECILNTPQTISPGAKITVQSGKVFRLLGNLTIQN